MTTAYNGGFYDYADKNVSNVFKEGSCTKSKAATIKSGQVLQALSFLQSDTDGKLIAHTGINETSLVTFATITTGQTLILGGLTFTAGSGSVTGAQLADIWSDLAAGVGYVAAAAAILAKGYVAATIGTFTAGTFGSWNTTNAGVTGTSTKVLFNGTAGLSNVTDLADTGTATDPTFAKVDGTTTFAPIAGVTIYAVNAASADVNAEVYTEASFYADKLVWKVDTTVDTVTNPDGTTTAVSAYNTGTTGLTAATTKLLRQKFVENSEFCDLVFIKTGEVANG
jgi:S-layer protein